MIEKLKELRELILLSEEKVGLEEVTELIQEEARARRRCFTWENLKYSPGTVAVLFVLLFFAFLGCYYLYLVLTV